MFIIFTGGALQRAPRHMRACAAVCSCATRLHNHARLKDWLWRGVRHVDGGVMRRPFLMEPTHHLSESLRRGGNVPSRACRAVCRVVCRTTFHGVRFTQISWGPPYFPPISHANQSSQFPRSSLPPSFFFLFFWSRVTVRVRVRATVRVTVSHSLRQASRKASYQW